MKKIFTLVACIFVSFAALLTLSGCGGSNPVEKETYTVTYQANGGVFDSGETTYVQENIEENSTLTVPASPAKVNFTFEGWSTLENGSTMWNFTTDKVVNNMTLYAVWKEIEPEKYTVTYQANGGVFESGETTYVQENIEENSILTAPASPTKVNFTFEGWSTLENGSTMWNFTTDKVVNNMTLYAVWKEIEPEKYTVTYFNGEEELKTESIQSGNEFEASYEPTIKGYTFTGWKDKDGKTFTKSVIWEDLVLYADTTANKYTITYDVNKDDGISQTTVEVTFDTNYTLSVPTRIGYSFVGWYIEGTKLTDETGNSLTEWKYDENKTVVAKYEVDLAMSNFDFTSSSTSCIITGVKDTTVTSIVVPNYVTSISKGAFSKCSNLVEITLPFVGASMTDTSDTYFGYIFGASSYEENNKYLPTSLKSVIIGDSVTSIGYRAFYGCSSLTSITILEGVTGIGWYAFYGCSSLTSIIIPKDVTSIGSSAFQGCSSLTSITLPEGVTSIVEYAFLGCYRLVEVYNLSNHLTITKGGTDNGYIGYYAKNIYTSLESTSEFITTEAGYKFYNDNGAYYLIGYYGNKTELILPTDINGNNYSINSYAFYGCSSLTSITIPEGVTSIGSSAFSGCSSLASITIPNSVESIGDYAFRGCYRLVEVYNLSDLTITKGSSNNGYIGYYAKNIYTSLESTSEFITTEAGYKFYNDNGAYYLIGYYGNKTELILPTDINGNNYSINRYAFTGCHGLTSIEIPNSVESIGDYAFFNCFALQNVTIPNSVESIGDYTFTGCSSLTSVTIGNSVESIGDYAFTGCSSLTSITIPDKVTSIGDYAFLNCSVLQNVTIPTSVTKIGNFAFSGCSSLTSITFEKVEGWYATTNSDYTFGNPVDVSNSSQNATYFRDTYSNYYWYREVM